jgi:hypothetical protein
MNDLAKDIARIGGIQQKRVEEILREAEQVLTSRTKKQAQGATNMKNLRSFVSFATLLAAVVLLLLPMPAMAQNNAFDAQFGATPWAQNNVRTASAYNWIIDDTAAGYLNFSYPSTVCTAALSFGGRGNVNPFTAPIATGPTQSTPNITAKFVDAVAANNETVAINSASTAGGNCTISFANVNTHLSYRVSSGTCGLQEAINDLGTTGGVVEYTQESVALGCNGGFPGVINTTITAAKSVLPNIYVHDISNGTNQWYSVQGNSLSLTAAPTALTTAGGTAATLQTSTTGGTIATGQAIRATIACMDFLGRASAPSTDSAGTAVVTTGAGSTNSITVTAPGTAGCPNSGGYRVYLSANSGASLSEIFYNPTNAGCTQSTLIPNELACSLTSNAVIPAIVTGTATVPIAGGTATATGLLPSNVVPMSPVFQTAYGPFPALATVSTIQQAAMVELPAGLFNRLTQKYRICGTIIELPVATAVPTYTLTLSPNFTVSPVTIVTWTYGGTATTNVNQNVNFCVTTNTAAVGTSGTLEVHGDLHQSIATTGLASGTTANITDGNQAASSAIDLTKQLTLAVTLTCATAACTTAQVRDLSLERLN